MDTVELSKEQAARLHLPPRDPIDGCEIVWGPRLPDPGTEYHEEQQAA